MSIKGNDILQLLPQRNPLVMVDELSVISRSSAKTALTVRPDNYFVYKNGELAETGLIEHVAQSASALAGYQARLAGSSTPPVGIIGEVRHFECSHRPKAGDRITTAITFGLTFGSVTMASGISYVDGAVIGRMQLKIFIQPAS